MPKKKGDKGGNPNPVRSPMVEQQVFPRVESDPFPNIPMTKKLQIWIYEPVANALDEMSQKEKVVWLRKVITEAAINELGVSMESGK